MAERDVSIYETICELVVGRGLLEAKKDNCRA